MSKFAVIGIIWCEISPRHSSPAMLLDSSFLSSFPVHFKNLGVIFKSEPFFGILQCFRVCTFEWWNNTPLLLRNRDIFLLTKSQSFRLLKVVLLSLKTEWFSFCRANTFSGYYSRYNYMLLHLN